MSQVLDRRTHAYRDDLAAAELAGLVEAARFVDGEAYQVRAATAPMHAAPDPASEPVSELLFGEAVTAYEIADGWAWGKSSLDDYVGYLRAELLTRETGEPTHVVDALATHIYPAPDIKAAPLGWLSLGSRLTVRGDAGKFSRLAGVGWVYSAHLAPVAAPAPDFVATAARYLGVPYLWGGRSSAGLDCSGLVQVALQRAGIRCPRDSDRMAAELGRPVPVPDDLATLRRGDLIFLPGHIMIAHGDGRVVHANATDMAVALQPLATVLAGLTSEEGRITAIRRVSPVP